MTDRLNSRNLKLTTHLKESSRKSWALIYLQYNDSDQTQITIILILIIQLQILTVAYLAKSIIMATLEVCFLATLSLHHLLFLEIEESKNPHRVSTKDISLQHQGDLTIYKKQEMILSMKSQSQHLYSATTKEVYSLSQAMIFTTSIASFRVVIIGKYD